MTPRLIATDLDGTLLRSDGTVGDRTVTALQRAGAAGIPVIPVTARPLRSREMYALLREAPYVVFGNGAMVYEPRAAAVVAEHELTAGTLAALCGRIRAAVPEAVFAVEQDGGRRMRHEPGYPLRSDQGQPSVYPATLAELVARPAVKLLVKAPGMAPTELVGRVAAAAGSAAEPSTSVPDGLVELAPPGITKASGLATVATRLGVAASEVVAFGDMPNDLPMLGWAGHAVAVANAHPDVLAVADEVTGSNDVDGVAEWIIAAVSQSGEKSDISEDLV